MPRLIDAEALRHAVANIDMHGESEQFYAIMGSVCKEIDAAPTIDMERHAHWNTSYRSGYVPKDGKPICSACDCWNEGRSNWCPNCGSRMLLARKDGPDDD